MAAFPDAHNQAAWGGVHKEEAGRLLQGRTFGEFPV
jgi:protein gp37